MSVTRKKFSSQARPDLLSAMHKIAEDEGRQFQAVLDEAMRDFIERKESGRPRRHVLEAFGDSLGEFDSLYRELAK